MRRCSRTESADTFAVCESLEPRTLLSADLRVPGFSLDHFPISLGDTVGIVIQARNTGDMGTGLFNIQGRLSVDKVWGNADDIIIKTERTEAGLPATSPLLQFETTAVVPGSVAAGSYYVGIRLDSSNEIAETNEGNNTRWSQLISVVAHPAVQVRGKGLVIADGDLSPRTADNTEFGSVQIAGASVVRLFNIRNTGTGVLEPGTITFSGAGAADFSVVESPTESILPGEIGRFRIRFNPSAGGIRQAMLTLNSNDETSPYKFRVRGTGTGPFIRVLTGGIPLVPGEPVPMVEVNESPITTRNVVFTIRNSGTQQLILGDLGLNSATPQHFVLLTEPDDSVDAGESTSFTLRLLGAGPGAYSVRISFATNVTDIGVFEFDVVYFVG